MLTDRIDPLNCDISKVAQRVEVEASLVQTVRLSRFTMYVLIRPVTPVLLFERPKGGQNWPHTSVLYPEGSGIVGRFESIWRHAGKVWRNSVAEG